MNRSVILLYLAAVLVRTFTTTGASHTNDDFHTECPPPDQDNERVQGKPNSDPNQGKTLKKVGSLDTSIPMTIQV
jgi:hypothetical protein